MTMKERELNAADSNHYPLLEVRVDKIRENMKRAVQTCRKAGVNVSWVIKGFNALPGLVERLFLDSGCQHIASSRLVHLSEARALGLSAPYMLIRVPMPSEVPELVRLADYSLESEASLVDQIEEECIRQNKDHKVILMADLGDLREGFWEEDELLALALHIENDLSHVTLAGIGTNLGCYGSIEATPEKMNELIGLAERIEEKIGRTLEIISGGGSTSYPLIERGTMPARINHLRMGEQIELAYDAVQFQYFEQADQFHQDTFVLQAEVLEVRKKPSHPVGKLAVDCFGNVGVYEDRGIRRRALLGVGKVDFGYLERMRSITPGIEILGASSDHTILDVEDCGQDLKPGDILSFYLSYPQVAMLTSSRYVSIRYLD